MYSRKHFRIEVVVGNEINCPVKEKEKEKEKRLHRYTVNNLIPPFFLLFF